MSKDSGFTLRNAGSLYPLLIACLAVVPVYHFGLLDGIWPGRPKSSQTTVWMVTYVGEHVSNVTGVSQLDLEACRIRQVAKTELLQYHDNDGNPATAARFDCVESLTRPLVTSAQNGT